MNTLTSKVYSRSVELTASDAAGLEVMPPSYLIDAQQPAHRFVVEDAPGLI